MGRHLFARAAIDDVDLLGAETDGGAGGVDGGVAAADDRDFAAKAGLAVEGEIAK